MASQPKSKLTAVQIDEAYEVNKALDVLLAVVLLGRLQAIKDDVLLLAPRFLRHVDTQNRPYPTSCRGYGPCLLWTGATDRNGYAVMWAGKKRQATHVAWFLVYGVWPAYLCHACDNRRCVAIEHLIAADAGFNAYDREKKKQGCFIENRNVPDTFQDQRIDPALPRQDVDGKTGPTNEPSKNHGP
jgi:hypothetical protein